MEQSANVMKSSMEKSSKPPSKVHYSVDAEPILVDMLDDGSERQGILPIVDDLTHMKQSAFPAVNVAKVSGTTAEEQGPQVLVKKVKVTSDRKDRRSDSGDNIDDDQEFFSKLFKKLDKDGDGSISLLELKSSLRNHDSPEIIRLKRLLGLPDRKLKLHGIF